MPLASENPPGRTYSHNNCPIILPLGESGMVMQEASTVGSENRLGTELAALTGTV